MPEFYVTVNAVGSWSIVRHGTLNTNVICTCYAEGIAHRICRILNEEGAGQ